MINPYIAGEHVYLRHPTEEDVSGRWYEWFSDEETTKYLVDRYWPNSIEAQLELFKSLTRDNNRLVLSIVDRSKDVHIGVLGLSSINWIHRYAEGSIIIGEDSYRKMPYTTETTDLMHKITFLRLNLLNLKSAYASSNEGAEALQQLFKYTKVGVYKKLLLIDGHADDLIVGVLNRGSWKVEMQR